MIQFQTVNEAIGYQPTCPVCHGRTIPDSYDAFITKSIFGGKHRNTILWKNNRDEFTVDLDTNEATYVYKNVGMTQQVVGGAQTYYQGTPMTGTTYYRLGIECENRDCGQYRYTIRVKAEIGFFGAKIKEVDLNSEAIAIEDDQGTTHEIRNVYVTGQTEYQYVKIESDESASAGGMSRKSIVLPLIPLNLQNPYKTLDRIKSLIIFS